MLAWLLPSSGPLKFTVRLDVQIIIIINENEQYVEAKPLI